MAIPDFQTIMLPMLKLLSDGQDWSVRDLTTAIADQFGLTQEEREHLVPSGQQTTIANRVSWARTYMKFAGLFEYPTRGRVRITNLGRSILAESPSKIDVRFLKRFPSYREFKEKSEPETEDKTTKPAPILEEEQTPHELIESAYQSLLQATAEEVLARLKSCSPAFFESVVVRLLMAMGYGGVAGHGSVTGKSGDGGIDGVIRQDKLGLDVVCIQAKRWEGPVGRPIVQQFVGSMDYYRAKKGVILTTSTFTKDGLEFLQRIEGKTVVLVDGDRLAALMIEHDLGVTTTKTYALKEVSNDFFDEGEG
ncbi:restriction endonuclease [Paludisphaera rhizosphaerae]|uniref:restriction endonuclease n=1 Tax=Paludisphaera rhizosphaerae TaxID=2711216 RepID=UPI0013EB88E2|nr:restriction endonuclease [Paludisphaera rhizosphaerae]